MARKQVLPINFLHLTAYHWALLLLKLEDAFLLQGYFDSENTFLCFSG